MIYSAPQGLSPGKIPLLPNICSTFVPHLFHICSTFGPGSEKPTATPVCVCVCAQGKAGTPRRAQARQVRQGRLHDQCMCQTRSWLRRYAVFTIKLGKNGHFGVSERPHTRTHSNSHAHTHAHTRNSHAHTGAHTRSVMKWTPSGRPVDAQGDAQGTPKDAQRTPKDAQGRPGTPRGRPGTPRGRAGDA